MSKKSSIKNKAGEGFTSRFRVAQPLTTLDTSGIINTPHHQVFTHTSLPKIPATTDELDMILTTFKSLNRDNTQEKTRRLISKFKKINGFIAFRSFYTKSIRNPKSQRLLSRSLGQIWDHYPNKKVWNRYAQEYNETAEEQDKTFVEWLSTRLNLDLGFTRRIPETNIVKNGQWLISSGTSRRNTVKDVYLLK